MSADLAPKERHRLQLIADLRACPLCVIVPNVGASLCDPHRARLDCLFPSRCSDPDCYACQDKDGAR